MKTVSLFRKLETKKEDDVPKIDGLRASASRCFSTLAAHAGLDGGVYSCGTEWIKNEENRLHIVQRYDGDEVTSVILKHAFLPSDPAEFPQILAAHQQAYNALENRDDVAVPKVLAQDVAQQAYLMEFSHGTTFLDLCRGAEDHGPLLRKAGAWIAAYHAGTFKEERAFQPKFMARHMLHLVNQMECGERKIHGQKKFIELAKKLTSDVGSAEGYIGKVSAKHGDLNAHNLLMSDHATTGFDFMGKSDAPVAYDISRFLLSYMQFVGDVDALPAGHVLPPDMMDAFWEGYDFINSNDPTVKFLMKTQVLTDWNRLSGGVNVQSSVRFARIKKIARQAFT